jgi:glyoxylase-like metal-dependent hydrolase (beta-lactamase superfamily II)
VIDPADLRWVYLTHPDRDHTGSLTAVLAAAPHARLVTTFLGMGILGIDFDISPPRGYLLNPAQTLDLGDRVVEAFRPPVYDSPATTGVFDPKGGACFTSDCFGAPMGSADLVHAEDVAVLAHEDLVAGQRLWTTVDSPWVTSVDRGVFAKSLDHLRRFDARTVLSSHLPPARNMPRLLDTLAGTPDVDPFVGPDQQALEAMLAQFEPAMR